MESSNAGAEVANGHVCSSTVVNPVLELVPNVPVSTTVSLSASTSVNSPSNADPTSNSATTNTINDAPSQPTLSSNAPSTGATKAITTSQTNPNIPRATSLPSAASEASAKNRSSREEKSRKKDDKSVDHVLRALNSLSTTEEKLAAMCKKYADFFDEHRKLQVLQKQTEKRCSMLQREKEQLQAEHSKTILTRSRLENLCRELQRQNKAIKDESLLKIREEEEKRKEVSAKFQTTMNEISALMQQNNDKNMKLRDDNIDMSTKLKSICEQYELRQQQVDRISKQMQLEQQLADAKLSKFKLEMAAERELLLKEKQQLLLELQQYQQRCTEFQATEVNLRNQISLYNDKYDEFQKALARSNDVFGGFKGEMEKMSKKICKLEKETSSWKQRWERSHNALLEMGADKQKSEQELAVVSRQLATLQGLCRTLQTERSNLMAKLKLLQGGGPELQEKSVVNTVEKCSKQCSQGLSLGDQPVNHVVEGDLVLNNCPPDIFASFKETEATDHVSTNNMCSVPVDSPVNNSTKTVCPNKPSLEPSAFVPESSLPDVVGTINGCVLDKNTEVNCVICPRLENTTLGSSSSLVQESPNKNLSNVVPIHKDISLVDQIVCNVVSNESSVIAENAALKISSPLVSDSNVLLNGSLQTDLNLQKKIETEDTTPPKSPTNPGSPTKSAESGNKTKDSAKKKKK